MLETLVITLIMTIGACFAYEIFFARPLWIEAARGFLPTFQILKDREMLYLAIGILGATVMPHNLYLHSSIVQTRAFKLDAGGKREAIRFATLDSTLALGFSLFINAAILVLGAAAFHVRGMNDVADISQAYQLLTPVLGVSFASVLFAAALLCSGQNSTLTGTLAGQIVMEGFLHWRLRPWLRRLITRSMAIIPAAIVIGVMGEGPRDFAADPEPGDLELPVAVCGGAADSIYRRPLQNGRIYEWPDHGDFRLVHGRRHYRPERGAPLAHLWREALS